MSLAQPLPEGKELTSNSEFDLLQNEGNSRHLNNEESGPELGEGLNIYSIFQVFDLIELLLFSLNRIV